MPPAYSGFNLLLADHESLWYGCNRAQPFARALTPGVYGLSNEFLDTPWPKLERVRRGFEAWLGDRRGGPQRRALFALLDDRRAHARHRRCALAPHRRQPHAVGATMLSAPFVARTPHYGNALLYRAAAQWPTVALRISERRFDPTQGGRRRAKLNSR